MDEDELEAIKQTVEQASADAAREAARADAMARTARQLGPSASSHLQDLERLRVSCVNCLTVTHTFYVVGTDTPDARLPCLPN